MKFRNRRSELLTCKECIHLLLDYADGSMVPEVRLKLDEHLSACPPVSIISAVTLPVRKWSNSYETKRRKFPRNSRIDSSRF